MTEITLFRFESKAVRTAIVHGEAVWIAKDVAEGLGYIWKGSASIKHIPDEWRGITSVQTPSGDQDMTYLTEAGLFFFLNRSDKPKALPFQKWVAGEVIPSIRKTGAYSVQDARPVLSREQQLASAVLLSQDIIREKDEKIAALAPKAESFDALANLEGRHNLRSAAAQCGWPQNKFIDKLISIGWVYVNTATGRKHAYSDRIKTGMMEVKNVEVKRTGYTEGVGQPMITQKGLARLKMLLGVYQAAPSREMELH
ncbi:prophage antirepressor [Gluconobacter frateurii NBRC 103465]|nr:prophage antirepressor [Gluconobacter frateurii NBRC 103465]